MEKQIKLITNRLKLIFILFWALPVLGVIVGETGEDWVGIYAGDVSTTYYAETLIILLTAICVPFSLKLFAVVMNKKIDKVTIPHALRLYWRWSCIRMLLLFLPVATGFMIYYMVLSNTGALCALISLTASLFCLPSEERLRKELHIDKEEGE
ncbi:MAG: hypothetical protein LKI39_10745 [Bacteroides sp.]|jgi:hypothetical protein|nr:hypothetical protein [Bacteroides sp.]MCI1683018.1 hypothetical protein [Bacteroides sp.]